MDSLHNGIFVFRLSLKLGWGLGCKGACLGLGMCGLGCGTLGHGNFAVGLKDIEM